MGFYESIRDNTAIPKVKQFGQPLQILRYENGVEWERPFNTETQQFEGESVQTPYDGYGLFTKFTLAEKETGHVQTSDKKILVVGVPKPETTDQLVIGGITYNVIMTEVVSPGGVDILFKVQVRS